MPSSSGLLHRPRVYQVIEEGLERKLTLVTAPAGYGKTSALVDFAQHSPVPVCWYTANEHDRDLGLFIQYLVGAINERFPGFGKHMQEILASLGDKLFQNATAIVEELVGEMIGLDIPFVLVVDNYQVLEGALGIREFFYRLIEVLPFNCHLMLGSRVMPDVPVARLIAEQQFTGLAEQHLRFEIQEILNLLQLLRIKISESQAEALATNSEGWITGVLLLADKLRDDAEAVLIDVEKASVETYNYLAREVLDRQPPNVRDFLCDSAVLREMSPRLCRDVLQIEKPHTLLAEIERRNLFVARFGRGSASTYRYHDLFREFLYEQLCQRDPARCAALHLQAAKWFEQTGDIEETIYHYLAAETYPEAMDLMERVAMEWYTRGRVETLLRWGEMLPDEIRSQAPHLSLYQCMAFIDRYNYEGARQALAYAETGLLAQKDLTSLAWVYNQRAILALRESRYKDTVTHTQMALKILCQETIAEQAEPRRFAWNAEAQRLLGLAYLKLGRLAEGVAKLRDALASYRRNESPYDVINLLLDLSLAFINQGYLNKAVDCLVEALAIGRRLGASIQLAGVLNDLGYLRYLCGRYSDALALYEEGLALARRGGDLRWQAYISVGLADLYRDIGAYKQAESLYNAGWKIARESEPSLALYTLAARADMYRWQGDHALALSLLGQAQQLTEGKELDFENRGQLSVAKGITLAESGEIEVGIHLLSDAVHFLERQGAKHELARAQFLLGQAYLLFGDRELAIAELRQSMRLADEIGTYQYAVIESQHTKELVELGIANGVTTCRAIIENIQQLRTFWEELMRSGAEPQRDAKDRLKVYALGKEQAVRTSRSTLSLGWRAMDKELFFYIFQHGPLERATIAEIFWPSLPTKRMVSGLYNALYRIRRVLGPDTITFREGKYRIGNVEYWFDVDEFEALVEQARYLSPHHWQTRDLWQQAVALYQGDFLPGVERSWCVPKREALREMYIEALLGIGQCHEMQKEYGEAIVWYRRALEVDELREDIHRHIMRCCAEAGHRSEALVQYDHCRKVLAQEMNIEPSDETRKLYEGIKED